MVDLAPPSRKRKVTKALLFAASASTLVYGVVAYRKRQIAAALRAI